MILLRALAGSRLYGTSGPDSDTDWYEVHDRIRTRQRKSGGQDVLKINLSHWLRLAEKGTHQALDAMWCPPELTEVDLIREFRLGFRPDPWKTWAQLEKTARALEYDGKKEKHADRLRFCAERVITRGWYDPSEWGRRG